VELLVAIHSRNYLARQVPQVILRCKLPRRQHLLVNPQQQVPIPMHRIHSLHCLEVLVLAAHRVPILSFPICPHPRRNKCDRRWKCYKTEDLTCLVQVALVVEWEELEELGRLLLLHPRILDRQRRDMPINLDS